MITKEILNKSPFGFLECRVIRDDHQRVCDFEISSYNPKFAELLSNIITESTELSANRIGALITGFNKQEREWKQIIDFVESGETCLEIETYFVSLDDWVRLFLFRQDGEAEQYGVMIFDTGYEKSRISEIESLFEASLDMLCIFDDTMQMVYLNNQWEYFTGYKRSELYYEPFKKLIHPKDRMATLREITRLPEVNTLIIRNRIITKSGELRHFEWKATLQNNRIYCAARDVTAEVSKGEEVQLLYKQLRSILDAMPNYIFAKDQQGRYLIANTQFANWYGYTPEEIIGKTDVDLGVDPKLSLKFSAYDKQVVQSGRRQVLPEMYEINRETGEEGWFQTVKIPYQHPGLAEDGILGISTNVTSLKQAELRLKQKTIQYDLALKGTKDGVWDWELNTGNIFYSARWMQQLGYETGKLPQTIDTFFDRLHPDDRANVENYLGKFISGETTDFDMDFRLKHKSGSYRWINGRAAAIRDASGRAVRIAGSNADITQRKQSDRDLLRLKQILIETNRVARIGSWEYVTATDNLIWTEVCYLIHDLEPHTIGELSVSDANSFCHPAFREKYAAAFSELLQTGKPYDIEVQIVTAKGRTVWVRIIGQAEIARNKVVRLFGSIQDIDERKRNRDELEKTREQLSNIISDMSDVVYSFDLKKKELLFITPSVEQLYGLPRKAWFDDVEVWRKHTHPEDTHAWQTISKALEDGLDTELDYRIIDVKGNVKWVRNRLKIVYDKQGNKKRLDGFKIDITNQKKAELEVAEYSGMLKTLINIIKVFISVERKQVDEAIQSALISFAELVGADRIYIFDFNATHTEMNMRYEWCRPGVESTVELYTSYDITSIPEIGDKIKKKQNVDVSDVASMDEGPYKEMLKYDNVKSIFCTPQVDEGHVVGFTGFETVREQKLFSANEKNLLRVFSDILVSLKQRLYLEQILDESRAKAEEASKAKSMFLANMSHEIRTPLNGVIGFSELLSSTTLNELQAQYVDYVQTSARSLMNILNDILDFSKIEAGKLEIEFIPTNIRNLVEETADIISFQATAKNIEIILDIGLNTSETILTDPIRLKQVLLNLMNNAVKFTDSGTVTISLTEQPLSPDRSRFSFEVRDTGIGIHQDRQQHLFKAFSQADSSDTRKYGGTGLGLAISSSIINKLGSKINLRSKPGKGSSFSFTLVSNILHEDDPEILEQINQQQAEIGHILKLSEVLIYDPVRPQAELLKSMVKSMGCPSGICASVNELSENLKTAPAGSVALVSVNPNHPEALETLEPCCKSLGPDKTIVFLYCPSHQARLSPFLTRIGLKKFLNLAKPVKWHQLRSTLAAASMKVRQVSMNEEPGEVSYEVLKEPALPELPQKKLTVLVAEDVEINMALIKTVLNKLFGHVKILEAHNGQEAVSIAREELPDFIIMDVQMPVMSGLDATVAIRNLGGEYLEVPIIALTAGVAVEEKQRCIDSGMTAFLSKPLRINLLKQVLIDLNLLAVPE